MSYCRVTIRVMEPKIKRCLRVFRLVQINTSLHRHIDEVICFTDRGTRRDWSIDEWGLREGGGPILEVQVDVMAGRSPLGPYDIDPIVDRFDPTPILKGNLAQVDL